MNVSRGSVKVVQEHFVPAEMHGASPGCKSTYFVLSTGKHLHAGRMVRLFIVCCCCDLVMLHPSLYLTVRDADLPS